MKTLDSSSRWFPPFLVLLVMAGAVSTDIYLPSLPDLTRIFHTSVSRMQLTLSVFFVGFAVAQLVLGPLSDRFGRRPVLLAGIGVYCLATLVCLTAQSVGMLIAARFLQALGACAGPVLARAIVRDVFPRDHAARVFATMAAIFAITPALAPIVGGHLHALFGWRANFLVMLMFGAVQFLGSWWLLAETNAHPDRNALRFGRMLINYGHLACGRVFAGNALMVMLAFSAMFTFISGVPFLLIDLLQVPPEQFGYYMAVVVVGLLIGSLSVARLSLRFGSERMVRIGVAVSLAAGLALAGLAWAGIETVWALIVPGAVLFLATALVMPSATALAIAPYPRIAGAASALLGFVQMIGAAFAGWLGDYAYDGSTVPIATVIGVLTILAALIHRAMLAPR